MANRRCLKALKLHRPSLLSSNAPFQNVITPSSLQVRSAIDHPPLEKPTPKPHQIGRNFERLCCIQSKSIRQFSSQRRNSGDENDDDDVDEDEDGDEDEDEDEDEDGDEDEDEEEDGELSECIEEEDVENGSSVSNRVANKTYSAEEKEKEAAAIGYKVIGPLDPSERPFTAWEPVFAVVQIGSHQFKVSNGDSIYTERLKFCEVNDKLILNKVLMLGSKSQTIIGRPILPDASVQAVVEEHALDAKVIIFKKKRRKNYRRTKGHRQELTRLRITDIQGIEKPEKPEKREKIKAIEKPEKTAVAA